MKFIVILATLFAVANAASPLLPGPVAALEGRTAEPEASFEFDARQISPRACKASNCACTKVQGQFCGNESINKACTNGHVFECNKSTGKTCDYGVRTSCQKCNKLKC